MALAKLRIIPLKANMRDRDTASAVEVMYNPKEITIESSAQFQRSAMPGLQTPVTQFVSGQTQTLSLDLFFDTYEEKTDVRIHTGKLANLLRIDSEIHAPPVCEFEWGAPLSPDKEYFFKGVLDRITQRFTMFLDSGIPVRATLTVGISEYQTIEEQLKVIKFRSSDRTKIRALNEGDQLWHLADQEYGSPGHWRVIADANDIENPRLLTAGLELTLPPLPQE